MKMKPDLATVVSGRESDIRRAFLAHLSHFSPMILEILIILSVPQKLVLSLEERLYSDLHSESKLLFKVEKLQKNEERYSSRKRRS